MSRDRIDTSSRVTSGCHRLDDDVRSFNWVCITTPASMSFPVPVQFTRADDTADASTVASTLGAACAPDGFEIVEQCPLPDVADRAELNKLIGQKILYAFDNEHYGWHIGTIAGTGLGTRDMKQTPRANCVVSYKKKETMVASLDGKVACELSKHLYGVDQWWVLLKKKAV